MSINVQEYENNLNAYNKQIASKKYEIAEAEKELIIAQTQLKNYEQQAKDIEEECLRLTGKPISELEKVITQSMNQLNKIMSKVILVSNTNNSTGITDNDVQDIEQFMANEF